MYYVFIDPSGNFDSGKGHTGVAFLHNDDWETLQMISITAEKFKTRHEYWNNIVETAIVSQVNSLPENEQLCVVIESFQIRTNGFLMGTMPETIRLIGVLEWYLELLQVRHVFQTPAQAKGRFKDAYLPDFIPGLEKKADRYYYNGKVINDHIRDALKHLLYFKKYSEGSIC